MYTTTYITKKACIQNVFNIFTTTSIQQQVKTYQYNMYTIYIQHIHNIGRTPVEEIYNNKLAPTYFQQSIYNMYTNNRHQHIYNIYTPTHRQQLSHNNIYTTCTQHVDNTYTTYVRHIHNTYLANIQHHD